MKDNYKVLGLDEDSSIDDVERTFKKLEKKYKNDNSKSSKNKFNEIKKAYSSIMDSYNQKSDSKLDLTNKSEESILNKITTERVVIFGVGLFLGLLIMMFFFPDRIAVLKSGEQVAIEVGKYNITADDLYNRLKELNSVSVVMEKVDRLILEDMYTLSDEDRKSIESTAQSYISSAQQAYQITEEEFLKNNNFNSKEEFLKYMELDYLRSTYFKENVSTKEDVEKFYNERVYGTINTEHILVKTEDMSDGDAKSKATEILEKLKSGVSWDDLKNQYSGVIVTESVPVEFDSNLESAYKNEAESLSNNSYSSSLVKTSYGYHIIYRKETDGKGSLESVKSRIQSVLASEAQNNDSSIYGKVLVEMRKNAKMDIKDTEIKKVYEDYINSLEDTDK